MYDISSFHIFVIICFYFSVDIFLTKIIYFLNIYIRYIIIFMKNVYIGVYTTNR